MGMGFMLEFIGGLPNATTEVLKNSRFKIKKLPVREVISGPYGSRTHL